VDPATPLRCAQDDAFALRCDDAFALRCAAMTPLRCAGRTLCAAQDDGFALRGVTASCCAG